MIIEFIQSDAFPPAVFSAVTSLLAIGLTYWLQARANLIAFSPNSTFFQLQTEGSNSPSVNIRSGQVMVQNLGRKSANNVQIVAGAGGGPAGYNIVPPIEHRAAIDEHGQWIVDIPFIGPKETITIQILNGPNIDSIRSEDGNAKFVEVLHQRQFPRWINLTAVMLMLSGLIGLTFLAGNLLF